jgi:hypothetical protein
VSELSVPSKYQAANWLSPISQAKAELLEERTRLQGHSPLWVASHRFRLTASKFFQILSEANPSRKFLSYNLGSVGYGNSNFLRASYGHSQEPLIKKFYTELCPELHLHDCGFVVNPKFSFLGASPDAKVCDRGRTGILEVKSPYSERHLSISEAIEQCEFFHLGVLSDGEVGLKKDDRYYYQVQGQLLVTGAPFCDFVLCTNKDIFVERIYPDIVFQEQLLHRLAAFYCKHILPLVKGIKD